MTPQLVSNVARFFAGGFQDRKGKKGTGEEENVSELVAEIEKGRITLPWMLARLILVLITLPSCLMKAAVPLVLGKGKD